MKLKDKVALIVGGASGIGRASSVLLAQEAAKVMIADVVPENADIVASEIQAKGGTASIVQVDFRYEDQVNAMVKKTLDTFGHIDIFVNAAGGIVGTLLPTKLTGNFPMKGAPVAEQTKELWDWMMDMNLNGPRHCVRAVINHMIERKTGKIVLVSSIAAIEGLAGNSDYTAAKAGIIGFAKALAREVAPFNIQVNCVTPSATWSEGRQAAMARVRQEQGREIPVDMSMMAMPEELAEAVLFLVSHGSDHMSGQNIIFGVPMPM
ncbi:MAG: SDR family oxidoreductase [Dehalococcoidales bacterium]|jgi:NAD(P)-dependent dehydrogenase (short-subunit alcohol dehydrogenase family)|nr:SDR family oxidoreductase [Dehalococcoidales bacterium]